MLTGIRAGTRVWAIRGPRQGRAGTVVSAPYYGTWFDGTIQGQVSVDYDDSDAPPLKTWLSCLEPLSAVELLGEIALMTGVATGRVEHGLADLANAAQA